MPTPLEIKTQQAVTLGWGDDAPAYAAWYLKVDRACQRISEVSLDDIGDWDYATAFEEGLAPEDAARCALESAGFPFED